MFGDLLGVVVSFCYMVWGLECLFCGLVLRCVLLGTCSNNVVLYPVCICLLLLWLDAVDCGF